jgi:6-phosphogluconolactonase
MHIFFADERCVPQSDAMSNFLLLHRTLLSRISIPEENVHAVDTALTPKEAAE